MFALVLTCSHSSPCIRQNMHIIGSPKIFDNAFVWHLRWVLVVLPIGAPMYVWASLPILIKAKLDDINSLTSFRIIGPNEISITSVEMLTKGPTHKCLEKQV